MKKILIIKHGALGDLIQTTGVFKSIRETHKDDNITLLVDKKFDFFIGSQLKFGLISPHYSGGRTTQKNTPARRTTRSPPQRQYMSLFCMHSLMEGDVVRNCTRNIEMGVSRLSRGQRWLYDSYLK